MYVITINGHFNTNFAFLQGTLSLILTVKGLEINAERSFVFEEYIKLKYAYIFFMKRTLWKVFCGFTQHIYG